MYNKNKKRGYIDFDNELNHPEIEQQLQQGDSGLETQQQFYNAMEFLCNQLFKFIEVRHSRAKSTLFKHYFLGEDKRSTYQQLSKITGYSTFYISTSLRDIKEDLRLNFITFINQN